MTDDPYAEFQDGPSSNFKIVLRSLADELLQAQAELEAAEEAVVLKKGIVKDYAETRIPAATEGMEGEFDLGDGRKLVLKEDIRASIAGAKAAPAIQWLDGNDYGHIVKRQVIFEFDKDDMESYDEFMEFIKPYVAEKGLVMKPKFSVHPQTLVSWVKEMLKEGNEFPRDTFGVFRQRVAKVKE